MNRKEDSIFHNIDWITIGLYFLFVFLGWINIYAAIYNEDSPAILDMGQKYGKQLMFIGGATLIIAAILIIDESFFTAFAYPIYGLSILVLISVLFLGTEISGSKSWFRFGSFGVQPAEFAKFATCLALAKFFSARALKYHTIKNRLLSFGMVLLPALIIIMQKETGGALVILALILVFFREGMPLKYLAGAVIFGLLFILALVFDTMILIYIFTSITILVLVSIKKSTTNIVVGVASLLLVIGVIAGSRTVFDNLPRHQKRRVNVFLGLEGDKQGKAWNETQSLIAIGSGGFLGKGFLQGTQTKFDFVPEQETDFIFCTVGEEWGFVGSTLVVLLFTAFILRLIFLAERQRSHFSRIYGYGIATIFMFHMMVNIGMTIGYVPVIGIPLPFFSYGGSSLWGFTILLFIFLKLDSRRLRNLN